MHGGEGAVEVQSTEGGGSGAEGHAGQATGLYAVVMRQESCDGLHRVAPVII
jgi:hypothetical protein